MATATVTTATSNISMRPMRGISIVIESATPATPTSEAAPTTRKTITTTTTTSNAEMSLKSQAGMLLAFGDSNNSSSNTTKDNLETSCNTEATATSTATSEAAAAATTKMYPQLLLRIGQTDDSGEIPAATTTPAAAMPTPTATLDPLAAATTPATPAAATTIISCNALPADSVDVAAIAAGEISTSDIALAAGIAATSPANEQHTVKIQIESSSQSYTRNLGKQISVVKLNDTEEMVFQQAQQQQEQHQQQHEPREQQQQQQQQHLCFLVSSGQYSPCETLDSGTGSDLESVRSPESNSQVPKLELHLKTTRLKVDKSDLRAYSLTDSEELQYESSSSSLSCDSLHSSPLITNPVVCSQEIRETISTKIDGRPLQYEADRYYNFHVNEHENFRSFGSSSSASSTSSPEYELNGFQQEQQQQQQEDAFAGYREVGAAGKATGNSTIRSAKGTVRGVKNRVRNGVATFLQLQQPNVKNFMEKDMGKVVLYSTSMGIIRDTYAKCANVKQILRTLLIKFEERDIFMSVEYQQEMRERLHDETIRVPQLFVEGQHIGDADTVERLNESGELRQLLKPYKSIATAYTCQMCGGYRLLPCPSCSGSKKSVHRNHFTAEFVALKCMNCDEVGLVKCPNC
ncbi:hypothetical protein KR009_008968 [Drosophila setifemur]|nr:hypothetical protein KR009_008968 [Drosophila setifemur]